MKTIDNEKKILANHVIDGIYNLKTGWVQILLDGIKSDAIINCKTLKIKNIKTRKAIKINKNDRYSRFCLPIQGTSVTMQYHRVIAALFVPIPWHYIEAGYTQRNLVPNHKNGKKHMNTIRNLEWVTQQENTVHAFNTGLASSSTGERSHLATITDKQAKDICELLSKGIKCSKISELMGINKKIIIHIYNGESWKQLSSQYVFPKDPDRCIPFSKSEDDIRAICKAIEESHAKGIIADKAIAEQFGTKREYVRDIRLHKRRTNISKDYNF